MVRATDAYRNRVGSNVEQNYPRGDTAKAIKSMFVTRDSRNLFMQFDLSQAELRGLGSFTKDPKLKHAYDQGLDLHSYTAANMFYNGDLSRVEKQKRQISKTINFSLVYGANAATVAANAGVPIAEAQDAMDKWFGFYANVKPWMEARGMDVETQGFVTGLWGLKRRLPAIMSKEADLADLKRQAGNSPIQGFASDFNCFLILLIMGQVKEKGLRDKIRMVNTVHDSIVFEVRKGYEEHLIRFYYEAMDSMNEWCAELFGGKEYYIDMRGDLEVGPNYGSLKGAKVDVIDHEDYSNYTYTVEDD